MAWRGGHRLPDSPNKACRVEAFNAYADHMQSDEFRAALDDPTAEAASKPAAIMCAEALPWQCHRRLIAEALIARGCLISWGQARRDATRSPSSARFATA